MALSRKRIRRAPRGWSAGLEDLHDYYGMSLPKRKSSRAPVQEDSGPITVRDDWPERVPISNAELRVIESFMAKELDELFGPLS